LADLTISVERFCEEATRFAGRWATDFIEPKKREKASKEADDLAQWGKAVRNRAMHVLGRLESPPTGSLPRQLEAAWRVLETVGLATRLQTVIEQLEAKRDQLKAQYSTESMKKVTDDFRTVTHAVTDLNGFARQVRESLRLRLDRSGFRTGQTTVLRSLIEEITKAITGTIGAVGDAWIERGPSSTQLPAMIRGGQLLKQAYDRLHKALKRDFDTRLQAAIGGGQDEARKFAAFLEDVEEILATIGSTVAYAIRVEKWASSGVDIEFGETAKQLKDEMHKLRMTVKKLDDLVWHYKDIVGRAPFKCPPTAEPTKLMPPWERLSQREQRLVSALVSLRRHDPAQEWYAVTKKVLEERLRLCENDSTLNRDLQLLEDEYGIVGKYQPIRSAEEQRPAYGYWIEEHAYKLYAPRVLGSGRGEASDGRVNS
jgi:DNA repair exonuclease SbcCD ATPase subunit